MRRPPLKNNLLPLLAVMLAMVLVAACSRPPRPVLGQEEMARLVADLELADAFVGEQRLGQYADKELRLELRRSVLAKHGINEATLDTSFRWYGANLPKYMQVLDRADSILADSLRAINLEEHTALASAAGDSLSIWPLSPSLVFAPNAASDFVAFEIEADTSWRRGDVLTLTLAVHNARSRLDATLAADYANRAATTEAARSAVYPGDVRKMELKLQLDSNMATNRVYGYLHLRPQPGERAFVDSIRLTRTRLVTSDYNHLRRTQRRIRRHDD